jgi:large subunit ribosomal protein L3
MALGLIGLKVGMTQVFTEDGSVEPVTVIQVGPCPVLQLKTKQRDGYLAVQLGFQDKPRKNATRPEQGHVAAKLTSKRKDKRTQAGVQLPPKADCEPQRYIREFRLESGGTSVADSTVEVSTAKLKLKKYLPSEKDPKTKEEKVEDFELAVGQKLTVDQVFAGVDSVDVIGTSKGRGYQGVMRRHNFDGLPAAHGAKKVHRQAGSTSSLASNRGSGRPKKGLKRAGQYGNTRVTISNLKVIRIDKDNNLILVRGAVPGFNGAVVMVQPTAKFLKRGSAVTLTAKAAAKAAKK